MLMHKIEGAFMQSNANDTVLEDIDFVKDWLKEVLHEQGVGL